MNHRHQFDSVCQFQALPLPPGSCCGVCGTLRRALANFRWWHGWSPPFRGGCSRCCLADALTRVPVLITRSRMIVAHLMSYKLIQGCTKVPVALHLLIPLLSPSPLLSQLSRAHSPYVPRRRRYTITRRGHAIT